MNSIVKNKIAFDEYEILEKHISGIILQGSEVKSIRASNVSIKESYVFINNGEIFIKGMHIGLYSEGGTHNNHIPLRDRKLLMKKKEIIKLYEKVSQKGLTLVPLEILISSTGFIKIEIGLGRGKNTRDKRQSEKLKDLNRELKRNI